MTNATMHPLSTHAGGRRNNQLSGIAKLAVNWLGGWTTVRDSGAILTTEALTTETTKTPSGKTRGGRNNKAMA